MNRKYLLFLCISLLAISCRDTASTGFLCNYSGVAATFVLAPVDTAIYAQQIAGGRVKVLAYDPAGRKATLEVKTDQCLWIANGINGFTASDLFIDYLEIRLPGETIVYDGREAIFAEFREVEKEVYEFQVR